MFKEISYISPKCPRCETKCHGFKEPNNYPSSFKGIITCDTCGTKFEFGIEVEHSFVSRAK